MMTTRREEMQAELPARRFEWQGMRDAVNFAGSLASLTGISLVWLKISWPNALLARAVPIFLIASLFAIGIVTGAYLLFMWGLHKTAARGAAVKVMYVCFALGALLAAVWIAAFGLYAFSMVMIYGTYSP
jgi:hypothetical protein